MGELGGVARRRLRRARVPRGVRRPGRRHRSRTRSRSRRWRGSARRRRCSRSSRSSAMTPVLDHGSEELKAEVRAPGSRRASARRRTASPRPTPGSDVAGMRTRAVRDGDHYVLTGRKLWITNAGVSDFYTVFAKTDPDAGHRGISCFVVETGVSRVLDRQARAQARRARLADRRGRARRLRRAGREPHRRRRPRLRTTRWVRSTARGRSSARRRSASPRARSSSPTQYVQERQPVRRAGIADFQGVQFMLADMATQVDAARLLVYRACSLLDAGLPGHRRSASSMAKLFASDTAMRVTTDCVQLLGGDRLHQGHAGRAVHARREDHADLRGHEPDPAHRDREASARSLT